MQSLKGTPLYLAPEMFTNSQYTHAADVWALGALLYELGKGAPPFYAENLAALAGKIVGEPVDLGGGGPGRRPGPGRLKTDIDAVVRRLPNLRPLMAVRRASGVHQ